MSWTSWTFCMPTVYLSRTNFQRMDSLFLCELGDSQTQLQILTVFMFLLSNKPFQCIFKISSFYCLLLVSSYNSLFWLIGSSFQKENLTALFSEVTVILIFASSLCSCTSWLVPLGRSFPWTCGLDLFPSFYLKY